MPRSRTKARANAPPEPARSLLCVVPVRVHHQPDGGGALRRVDVIHEPAGAGRRAAADRQVEDLLGDLGHALEVGAAAGEDEAGVERAVAAGVADLVPQQVEDLLGARLQDLREDAARHQARLAAADAGHLHRLVLADHGGERAAAAALDLLGLGQRRAQADGDVVGEVIAADRDDAGVPHRAALVDDDVGGAAADVDEGDAELLLVARQHRFGRGELAQRRLHHVDAGAVDAGDQVLRRAGRAVDDVDVDLEARAGHADRRADAVLLVDHEVLRQDVDDLAAGRQRHRLGGVEGAAHVLAHDLAVLAGDGDDAAAVDAVHVRARQPEVHGVDLDAGGELGLLERFLDRLDRGLEIDDDAAADAARIGQADADDVERSVVARLADDRGHLRRAHVEPDDVAFLAAHHCLSPSVLTAVRRAPGGRARV